MIKSYLLLAFPIVMLVFVILGTAVIIAQEEDERGICTWPPVVSQVCVNDGTYVNHCFVYNATYTDGICAGHEEFWD